MKDWSLHCKIIGVELDATIADITAAFRKTAEYLDSDENANSAQVTAKLKQLQDSYYYLLINFNEWQKSQNNTTRGNSADSSTKSWMAEEQEREDLKRRLFVSPRIVHTVNSLIDETRKRFSRSHKIPLREEKAHSENEVKVETSSDPYKILGVSNNATPEEVKHAYYALLKEYHPDRVASLGPKLRQLAEEESRKINSAYSAIKMKWTKTS